MKDIFIVQIVNHQGCVAVGSYVPPYGVLLIVQRSCTPSTISVLALLVIAQSFLGPLCLRAITNSAKGLLMGLANVRPYRYLV